MQQLKIVFFLLGSRNKASSRVRGFWVAEELESLGMNCTIVYGEDLGSFFRCLKKLPFADILFIQKRYSRWDYYLVRLAGFLGKKIIFDIDDAYSKTKNDITLHNIIRIMKKASAVTVGSLNLLEFAKQYQANSYLLPTSVKLKNYSLSAEQNYSSKVCLGWIGNGAHYYMDLIKILKEPLVKIASQHKVRFKLVGACGQKELYQAFFNIPGLSITFIDALNWADASEVRKAIQDFDIGLYPVQANDFNSFKCGFKALEYMALGMPVVASPVGANSYIVTNGIDGFLANGKEEWVEALSILISDQMKRKQMGIAGRQKVETQYNISKFVQDLTTIMFNLKQ
jgi:glycosyltransferase involved in cell wall biosynthesis